MPESASSSSGWYFWWIVGGGLAILSAAVAVGINWPKPSAKARAERAVASGQRSQAAKHYEEHLREHPADHSARMALGALWERVDPPRALELFEDVPEDSPEYAQAQRHVAAIALHLSDDRRAEQALLILARFHPHDPAVRLSLAELFHRQMRANEALAEALRCTELQPDRVLSWLLLAEIYDDLRRPQEMIGPLHRALELEPELFAAHLNLSYACVASGEIAEGRREAEWCLEREPGNVAARRFLAMCEREEGHTERALEEIRRALQTAPDDFECRLMEGQLLLYLRRADEAYRRLRPLLSRHQNDRKFLTLLGRAAAASDRGEEAARYLRYDNEPAQLKRSSLKDE